MNLRRLVVLGVVLVAFGAIAGAAHAQALTVLPPVLPNWTQGQSYVAPTGAVLGALGGLPPITFTVTAGALPPGLGFTTTVGITAITGIPTTPGTYTFTITARDVLNRTGSLAYTVTINGPPAVSTTALPDGRVDQGYDQTLALSGGTAPVGWTIPTGSLPDGLSLNPLTGRISGTPTREGTFAFSVRVTDVTFAASDRALTIVVRKPPSFAVVGTTVWTVGRSGFSLLVTGSGGQGMLTWGAVTGVPDGLVASRTGDVLTVSGMPTAVGTFTLGTTITDEASVTATLAETLRIRPPVSLDPEPLAEATVGFPWTATASASDGTPPYVFSPGGSKPAWVALGASGDLTGTPPTAGTESVAVEVAGAAGSTDTRTYAITVNPTPRVDTAPMPVAVPDREYVAALPVTGGTAPFSVALQSGSLPDGLAFEGLELRGIPTSPGRHEATLVVTDRWGASALGVVGIAVARPSAVRNALPAFSLPAGARQAWVIDVLADTELKLKLKMGSKGASLDVTLVYVEGDEIDVTPYRRDGSKKVKLKKVPVPRTGRLLLVLDNDGEAAVEVSGKLSGKASSGLKETTPWSPGAADREVPFAALGGSRVTIEVKAKNGAPPADFVSLTGPSGAIDVGAALSASSKGFKIKKLDLPEGGDHVLAFRPRGDGADGRVKVSVSVRSPDDYVFSAPQTAAAPLRRARGPRLLFQDDLADGPSPAWRVQGARWAPDAGGASLVAAGEHGEAAVGDASWRIAEAHVRLRREPTATATLALVGPEDVTIELGPDRTILRRGDEIRGTASAVAGTVEIDLILVDGVVSVRIDGEPALESEEPDLVVSGLSIGAGPAGAVILERVAILGD